MSKRGSCVPILHRVYVLNSDPGGAFFVCGRIVPDGVLALHYCGVHNTPMGLAPAAGWAAHTRPTRLFVFQVACLRGRNHTAVQQRSGTSLARTPQPILDLTLPKFLWFSPSRRLLLAPSRELLPCRPPALSKLCGTCFCSRGCSWRILRRAP